MNPIIILSGKEETGKSTIARQIALGHKTSVFYYHKVNYKEGRIINELTIDTQCVIIEEVDSLSQIRDILRSSTLTINKKGKEPFTMERPRLIIVLYPDAKVTMKEVRQYTDKSVQVIMVEMAGVKFNTELKF